MEGVIFANNFKPEILDKKVLYDLFAGLLMSARSIRRFEGDREVGFDVLKSLVDLTRYCSSGRNLQPLKYRIVADRCEALRVYPLLKWAGYLPEWDGPEECERPTAYLVQCLDTRLSSSCLCDDGLQLQAITLGATALGLSCCIIKAFNSPKLAEVLELEEWAEPRYVVAIGYPKEEVRIVETNGELGADIKYYRDAAGVHYVPKRRLQELLISTKSKNQ